MGYQDILYLSLSFGFLLLMGSLSYFFFNATAVVKSTKLIVDDTHRITADVANAKDGFKVGVLSLVNLLGYLKSNKKGR